MPLFQRNEIPQQMQPLPKPQGSYVLHFLVRHYAWLIPLFVAATSTGAYHVIKMLYLNIWMQRAIDFGEHLGADLLWETEHLTQKTVTPAQWQEHHLIITVDQYVRRYLDTQEIIKIYIYDNQKNLVYSTNSQKMQNQNDSRIETALQGKAVATREQIKGKKNKLARGESDFLHSFVPFRLSDSGSNKSHIVGVIEIHQSLNRIYHGWKTLGQTIFAGSIAIVALLGILLGYIAHRTSQIVSKAHEEQERLKTQLQILVGDLEKEVAQRTAEVHREHETLVTILDQAPSAMVLLDNDNNIQYVNRRFFDLYHTNGQEIIGRSYCEILGCDQAEDHFCSSLMAIKKGKPVTTLAAHLKSDSVTKWYEHTAILLSIHGSSIRIVEMITDVTERRQSEQNMIRTSRLATIGEMAAAIAHEVRNSATTTKLFLQLLSERSILHENDRESLHASLSSVSRMESLVDNLLRLAQPIKPSFVSLNLAELVHAAVTLLRPEARRKGIKLVAQDFPDESMIYGDYGLLTHVFLNVILNAIQSFGDAKGHAARKIHLTFQKIPEGDIVCIHDNGSGISPENLNRVFDPFFTTKKNGTGLGLAISHRIITNHNGSIHIESKQDIGTMINIFLPKNTNHFDSVEELSIL